jgi:tetratricopeptide (TPR) repeat protein
MKQHGDIGVGLTNLSDALLTSGALFKSEAAAHPALAIANKISDRVLMAVSLYLRGAARGALGNVSESKFDLQQALQIFIKLTHNQFAGVVYYYLAQSELWLSTFDIALSHANQAWELAHALNYQADLIRAARVQGEAALGLDDFAIADERLHHALTRARMVNLVEEELPALVALAELRRRQGESKAAREFLDDVWEAAARGPYPLIHADASNVLAQIERDAGNEGAAVEAAERAYRLAWCDGPPFAYHWGLEKARGHLRELGAREPELPPFDESKFEPMPEVEIDPEDEFHAGKSLDA